MTDLNLDSAIAFVTEKLSQQGGVLSAMDEIILEAAWNDLTYLQMSEDYEVNFNTLNGRTAPLLWKKLKSAFGQKVGKKTFRKLVTMELVAQSNRALKLREDGSPFFIGASLPNIDGFVGRDEEVTRLVALVNKFSLVLVIGLEGIGKKALVSKAIRSRHCDLPLSRVFWKPLHHLPSAEDLEYELLNAIGAAEEDELIERLQAEPFLIVLESIDALLSPVGRSQFLDPQYVSLFRRITEETPSRIIATSTQTIPAIEELVLRGQAMLCNLAGVALTDAESILGSHWSPKKTEDVWKAVGGNPLMLKELSAWSEYAGAMMPETHRLSVISALVGNFYEKILQSVILSTSDLALLKSIAEYAQGVSFSKLLSEKPKAAPTLKRLIDMGLAKKDYRGSEGAIIHIDPLLERALGSQA